MTRVGEPGTEGINALPANTGESCCSCRYVYGIAAAGARMDLGAIGIEGKQVYTVPYQDMCAIVHDCAPEPYASDDSEVVKEWVSKHQFAIEEAARRVGNVIPMGFDTIIEPSSEVDEPDQAVRNWLREDYDRLKAVFGKIEGKDEYVIKVYYDPGAVAELVSMESEEAARLKEELSTKSPGLAYIYKQRLENAVKSSAEAFLDEKWKAFYQDIRAAVDDVVVEKAKRGEKDRRMLMNLSCLVARDKVAALGDLLEGIVEGSPFSVHFSGPWPPYSFVERPSAP